ncbi:MAG: NADH:flavin oxidoreductase [Chloroflexi bacterium]|jgi:2,4-dienoyl-CoA reductase-like NADH-dependent reductase (Old Yellow Enzyme family)|nr:NADH:flavin oxidoreductase [Chloroflexota bacterium]MBT7081472.1 NADH:flavin oxidoreductase [Chloroflexota bacterium]MBT7289753.1 NADH:flavin oxidoreductase [Chloroflexota bacterium]
MPTDLFAPYKIKNLKIKNRFMRSATWDGSADDSGAASDASVDIYNQLGRGGVGLIITGFAFTSSLGQAMQGQYGAHSDEMLPGLQKLVQAAHSGGAKIALQIVHAGIASGYLQHTKTPCQAVSPMPDVNRPHKQMSDSEIEDIIDGFAAAALRAKDAGFDAAQLHGAHGYLMSQFLSPVNNHRTDKWGGSPENRRRFHIEVIRRIRQAVGPDFPLMIKFGVMDDAPGGLSLDEGMETARSMIAEGIDSIEVSGGIGSPPLGADESTPEHAFYRQRAAALKKAVSVPVMVVAGIRSLKLAQDIVDSDDADMISMCRPFIREPGLINRWQSDDQKPATCISCRKCFSVAMKGKALACYQEQQLQK